jgi:hypothetical protein
MANAVASKAREGMGTTDLREIILGAQDNLVNVLATVLGVAIGSGSTRMVALAGVASGIAEAISMGGVLYTSTCAERDLARRRAVERLDGSKAFTGGSSAESASRRRGHVRRRRRRRRDPPPSVRRVPIRWAMLAAGAYRLRLRAGCLQGQRGGRSWARRPAVRKIRAGGTATALGAARDRRGWHRPRSRSRERG